MKMEVAPKRSEKAAVFLFSAPSAPLRAKSDFQKPKEEIIHSRHENNNHPKNLPISHSPTTATSHTKPRRVAPKTPIIIVKAKIQSHPVAPIQTIQNTPEVRPRHRRSHFTIHNFPRSRTHANSTCRAAARSPVQPFSL
jgi:hypothetical protein